MSRSEKLELELLRAEREPFKVLMDRALEAGLAHYDPLRRTVDAGVLDLAERLGFRRPEMLVTLPVNGLVLAVFQDAPGETITWRPDAPILGPVIIQVRRR